jgi:hypothetical protein
MIENVEKQKEGESHGLPSKTSNGWKKRIKKWINPQLFTTLIVTLAATLLADIAYKRINEKKAYENFYSFPYITFEADNTQVFRLTEEVPNLEYSVGEKSWEKLGTQNIVFGGSRGKLLLRGTNSWGTSWYKINHHGLAVEFWATVSFATDAQVICSGDIRTLIDYTNYNTVSTKEARFNKLFENCTQLVVAPELPSMDLAENCYESMFSGCTSLKTAPDLPADTLAYGCYEFMFSDCISLEKAPKLLAENLDKWCYWNMFSGCTSLERAPELPAKQLAYGCYAHMFSDCSSLERAPYILPAMELADNCYWGMFSNCISLERACILPARNLAYGCYLEMFSGCTSLSAITMLATDISVSWCLKDWLKDTAPCGTLYKNIKVKWDEDGIVPTGWKTEPALGTN